MKKRETYMDVKVCDMDRMFQEKAITGRVIAENAKYIITLEKEVARLRSITEGLDCQCVSEKRIYGYPTSYKCQGCKAKQEARKEAGND